jgi:hypothetical protein
MVERYDARWTVPVTLREIEETGLPLSSDFGIDDQEHAELLDDDGILRINFGLAYKGDAGDAITDAVLEVYNARPGDEADWGNVLGLRRSLGWYGSRWDPGAVQHALEGLIEDRLGADAVEAILFDYQDPQEHGAKLIT